MDIKTQLLSEIDGLISHYESEKISLSHVPHGTLKESCKFTSAIIALNTLKSQIETIKTDNSSGASASDFSNEVINKIKAVHQIMRSYTTYASGTYLDAKPGIIEALGLVEEYIPRLEEAWSY